MPTAMTFYPNETWLTQLRPGNHVYLVKEGRFAHVEWPWEPPLNEFGTGRIGLRFEGGRRDTWGLRANGQGNDGSQCLMPVEGELLANPDPLPEPEIRQLQRRLAEVEARSSRQWEQINRQELLVNNLAQRVLRLVQLVSAQGVQPPEPVELEEVFQHTTSALRGVGVQVDQAYANELFGSRAQAMLDQAILSDLANSVAAQTLNQDSSVSISVDSIRPSEERTGIRVGEIRGWAPRGETPPTIVQVSPKRTSRFDRIDEE